MKANGESFLQDMKLEAMEKVNSPYMLKIKRPSDISLP